MTADTDMTVEQAPNRTSRRAARNGGSHAIRPGRSSKRVRRGARMHRVVTILMMVTFTVLCLGLVGVFAIQSGMLDEEPQNTTANQTAKVSRKSVKMVQPTLTGFDRKSQAYVLKASSAVQDPLDPSVIVLEKVVANMKLKKSGDVVKVTADTGTYNGDKETLLLVDNIKVTSSSGYTALLSTADVHLKKGRVTSDRPVVVLMPTGKIEANGVELTDDGDKIKFLNRMRMILKGDKQEAG